MATRISRTASAAIRGCLIVVGCLAIVWGLATFPAARIQSSLSETASRIVDGESYRLESLMALMPQVEAAERAGLCRAGALHGAAIVRLRVAEEAMAAGRRDLIDNELERLHDTIRASLSCSPADPFLWLILFWVENTRNGFKTENLKFLRLSYALGPNEGWIALKRNHVALSMLGSFPPDLRELTIAEFAKLVDTELYNQAALILTGPGWAARDVLLTRLATLPQRQREGFARVLRQRGYDLTVPGVVERERPYR
jgi:hypothetical protein